MHWRTKRKLQGATKLYLTLTAPGSETCTELRIQLPDKTYVYINLSEEWPSPIKYNPLGFSLSDDNLVHHDNKTRTLKRLNASRSYGTNNSKTVDVAINLINTMTKRDL